MVRYGAEPYLECSSKGDKRFSAFYAKIKSRDNRSIEDIYQGSKVFEGGITDLDWRAAKGKLPVNIDDVRKLYSKLWDEYIEENPELLLVLKNATGISDIFGNINNACQATELWRIKNKPLEKTMIFVFGSNRKGIHGKGAALTAKRLYGAINGVGEGLQGDAYAIPTKDDPYTVLSLSEIKKHVDTFITYAQNNPNTTFKLTRFGCGLSGYKDAEILSLLKDLPKNCLLPGVWHNMLNSKVVRLIVAGGRDFNNKELLFDYLDEVTSKIILDHDIVVVSGKAQGADSLGEEWAKARSLPVAEMPADWDLYGKSAGYIRNTDMAWYSTHLVAFWDGSSKGTRNMIDIAKDNKLKVKVVLY